MTQNEKFQIQRRNTLRNLWQKLSVKLVLAALYLMGAAYVCVKQAAWRTLAGNIPLLSPLLKAAMEQERRVENFIDRIPNDSYRLMLKLRYLDCLSWERVQELLSRSGVFYSDRHIYRLHGEALEAARRLWAQDNKEEKS